MWLCIVFVSYLIAFYIFKYFVFNYDFAFKYCLVLNCLMSYLSLNNNIVSCFNYLCHVVLSLIFLFIVFYLSCYFLNFIIVFLFFVFLFPCFYLSCLFIVLSYFYRYIVFIFVFYFYYYLLLLLLSMFFFLSFLFQVPTGQEVVNQWPKP